MSEPCKYCGKPEPKPFQLAYMFAEPGCCMACYCHPPVNHSWQMIADMVAASLNELYELQVIDWTPYGFCQWRTEPYNAHITIASEPGTPLATCSINGWLIYLRHVEGIWEAYTAIPEYHFQWRAA